MRLPITLPDGLYDMHIEVYYPDEDTLHATTKVMAGVTEIRVRLPDDPEKCLIRAFPVQHSEPVSAGYVYWDGRLRPYKPEIHKLSTAGASTTDEPVESVEETDEPPADVVEEALGPALDLGEPLELDSSAGLSVVTEAGIEPLDEEEPAESEDKTDE